MIDQIIQDGLSRWLHGIDLDPCSKTFGYCDRDYWAWKLKDFNNSTLQGGLPAFLDMKAQFPQIRAKNIVTAVIAGTHKQQRNDGSFEEAYPLESSCCVTALVLFNLLYAFFLNPDDFNDQSKMKLKYIVTKGYKFLQRASEGHGKIANHQATIIFAQWLSEKFLGTPKNQSLQKDFLKLQDSEGWFYEYYGADPGYQTLLNHYIAAYSQIENLGLPLRRAHHESLKFCNLFCFNDGSYAGELGVRGTHIVYPSGTLMCEGNKTSFSEWFTSSYASTTQAVTPVCVDTNNLVPVLCSWSLFHRIQNKKPVVALAETQGHLSLPQAGFELFYQGKNKLIISKKTAVLKKSTGEAYSHWAYQSYTTQHCMLDYHASADKITIILGYRKNKQMLNDGFKMAMLRCIALLIYPCKGLQNFFKIALANQLMGGLKVTKRPTIKIMVDLSSPDYPIKWKPASELGKKFMPHPHGFQNHMASANTFQNYDYGT
jgi:hypothetical protein